MIEVKTENDKLILGLEGRIDAVNAPEVQKEIDECLEANPHTSLDLDFEKIQYVSSAGLRVLLRLRKKEPEFRIINVCTEVYEVFEMTGFTEMLDIRKAFRHLSIEGCEVIGKGANGIVYRYEDDTIVKVYFNHNNDPLEVIRQERELARKAFILGIPTAIPYDVVMVGDKFGSVFERLHATSFCKILIKEPERVDEVVDMYVDLMKKLHTTHVKPGDMPRMKDVAQKWVAFLQEYLPAETFTKLKKLVDDVPDADTIIHGDYHIKNVMEQDGEILLIDMDTLCYGYPVFELGTVWLAYVGFGQADQNVIWDFMGLSPEFCASIWEKTMKKYFNTEDPETLKKLEDKIKIIGNTRMMRRTIRRHGFDTEMGRKEIEMCRQNLIELVEKTDDLLIG